MKRDFDGAYIGKSMRSSLGIKPFMKSDAICDQGPISPIYCQVGIVCHNDCSQSGNHLVLCLCNPYLLPRY